MKEHGSNFKEQLLPLIKTHLHLSQENFEKYFNAEQNATFDANSWILQPFASDRSSTDPKDLIDLQTDFGVKALFKETPYTDFWVHLLNVPEYSSLVEKAVAMLIQMPTTYLSESGFSCLCEIKSQKRNSIIHIDAGCILYCFSPSSQPFKLIGYMSSSQYLLAFTRTKKVEGQWYRESIIIVMKGVELINQEMLTNSRVMGS